MRDVNLCYGDEPGAARHHDGHRREAGHRVHRPVGLRQVHAAALPQPHERPHRRRADHRDVHRARPGHLRRHAPTSSRCAGASAWCSRSRTRSRSRSTRTSSTACASPASRQGDARRGLRAQPARRRAVGRGQGPAARERPVALRRPAAAAVHRARDRGRAGDRPDGRALLGARSDRHAEDRGADLQPQERVHDRHRDAQPAAGGARLGQARRSSGSAELVEYSDTPEMFTKPKEKHTEDYITGRFG